MRIRAFNVLIGGRLLFVVYCYTSAQVRALVASRLSDTTAVKIVAQR